ncbi:MAG TPA: sulfotransferase, partial [Panacibacter sp.]|nr:sulfotransferase [Panacibacter sp.]
MSDTRIEYEELLEKPIIIFGSGRSGTTIISEIIFQHEQLAWHSNYQEIFKKSTRINYLRRLFENKFWRLAKFWVFVGVSKNTRQKWGSYFSLVFFNPIERYAFWEYITGPRIDFSRGFLVGEKATADEKNKIRKHLAKQVKYQGRKRLIMKFTGPSRLEYLSSIFPDAVFVSIAREPIATVRSWLKVGFWQTKGINRLWWIGPYTSEEETEAEKLKDDPALITAFQYKKLMEVMGQEIIKTGVPILETRYEDFVKDPRVFIRKILGFVELPPSKNVDRYIEEMVISNRNAVHSEKLVFSDETKKRILEIAA